VTDLGVRAGKKVRGNVPEWQNSTFIVVICRVPKGNNDPTSRMQIQASYIAERHWEEQICFIKKNCSPEERYCLTALSKCTVTQEELDEEYMGIYPPAQMINVPLYGQISYNSSLSNTFKSNLGHNVNLFW
jgi:hypothetical protein